MRNKKPSLAPPCFLMIHTPRPTNTTTTHLRRAQRPTVASLTPHSLNRGGRGRGKEEGRKGKPRRGLTEAKKGGSNDSEGDKKQGPAGGGLNPHQKHARRKAP